MATEHPPAVFTCPYCGATFSSQAELDAHIATEHPPTVYTCPYCGATFNTQEELNAHIAAEHPEEPPPEGELAITNVTWENNLDIVAGDFATSFVKATVMVNNPGTEFKDKLSLTFGKYENGVFTKSAEGVVSKQKFMTVAEWQAELDWFDKKIAQGYDGTLIKQKAKVEQYRQCDGFVYDGSWALADPNANFEDQLWTSGGSKVYKSAEYRKDTITNFVYPTGQYDVKCAFSIWAETMGGDFDILVSLEGKEISYICLNALTIVLPVLPEIKSVVIPPVPSLWVCKYTPPRVDTVEQPPCDAQFKTFSEFKAHLTAAHGIDPGFYRNYAGGTKYPVEITAFLPNPLHYPGGVMPPVYRVTLWCPKLWVVYEYITYYYQVMSIRIESDQLTVPDGIYTLTDEGEAAYYKNHVIADPIPVPPGIYKVNGTITAAKDINGTTKPGFTWELGQVGTLEVVAP